MKQVKSKAPKKTPKNVKAAASFATLARKLYIKIPAQLAVFLLIIVIAALAIAQPILTSYMTEQAHDDITALSTNNAQLARDYFEAMQTQSKTLAMMFSKMEADVKGTSDSSTYVIPIIRSVLYGALEDARIYGAYAAFEPNKYFPYTPEGISFHAYRDGEAVKLETQYDYKDYGNADYYYNTTNTKRAYITEPYDYVLDDGRTISLISISNPILNAEGECVGVANCDIMVDTINELSFDMGDLETAYQFILTGNKHYIAHSERSDLMGTAYQTTDEVSTAEMISAATGKSEILTEGKSALTGKDSLVVLMPTAITGVQKHFVSAFIVDKSETLSSLNMILNYLRLGLIGFVFIFMVLFALLMRRALSPVGKIVQFSMDVQNGNLDTDIKLKSRDELLDLYNAVNGIRNTIRTLVSESILLTEAAVKGNLEERADAEQHKGEYKRLVEGINGTLDAIVEPVVEIIDMLQQLQRGNLGVRIEKDYQGEFALIRDSFNETMDALNRYIGDVATVLKAVSEGDLTQEITSDFHGDFVTLKDSINNILASLNDTLASINIAADQVASGTRQVSGGSQSISQGATEQASAIEELTATITEIAAQTKENAKSANYANELSIAAKGEAAKGTEHMANLQSAMEEINEASVNIKKIIKVIDEIAFQTNILALNAAVEAARAGQHGRGFAVVAEEVRNLAARSAQAAKETTELIQGSIKKAEAGTKIADSTAASLASIVTGVDKTVELVGQIAVASNEQATGIAQGNRGIDQLSDVGQTNSATAEEAAAASEELSGQAELLKSMVAQFQLQHMKPIEEAPEPEAAEAPKKKRHIAKETPGAVPTPEAPKILLEESTDFGKY